MARFSLLVLLVLVLAFVSVDARKIRRAARAHPLATKKCRTTALNCHVPPLTVTVSGTDGTVLGETLYTYLTGDAYNTKRTTVVINTNTPIVLTRGIPINTDHDIKCGAGYTCEIDFNLNPADTFPALQVQGGSHCNFYNIKFNGLSLERSVAPVHLTGQNTVAHFYSCSFENFVSTDSKKAAIALVDRNCRVIFTPTLDITNSTGDFLFSVTANGGATEKPSLTLCYTSNSTTVAATSTTPNSTFVQSCSTSNATAPVVTPNGTSDASTGNSYEVPPSQCPITACHA